MVASNEYLDCPLRSYGIRSYNAPGNHQSLAEAGNLSNAIVIPSNASIVHCTGQVGKLPDGSIPEDINEEYRLAFENVKLALEAAGVKNGWKSVYKLHWLVVGNPDQTLLTLYGKLVSEYCGATRPAQASFATTHIIWPNAHVELVVEAVKVGEPVKI